MSRESAHHATPPAAIHPRLRVTLRGEIAFGPGKAGLLALIAETGSIHDAADRMEMSYMRAWSLIQTMNRCFKEPLVMAIRGGRGGGGASLTPMGRRALGLYQRMEKAGITAMQPDWRRLKMLLRSSTADEPTARKSRPGRAERRDALNSIRLGIAALRGARPS